MKEKNIRYRIIVPMALALVIIAMGTIFGFYTHIDNHLDDMVRSRLDGLQSLFSMELDEDAELMSGLMDFLKKDKRLQTLWLAQDREALLHYAAPIFKEVRAKYRVTHLYFHGADRVCFLRVHNPPRHGDFIDRFTMKEAAGKGKTAQGIELGPFGTFTLRVVHPWLIGGKLAGYIEFGEEIEHITAELKEILGVELVFTINKSFLDRGKWAEGLKMMGRTGEWDRFANCVVISQTIRDIPGGLNKYMKTPEPLDEEKHLSSILKISGNRQSYRSGFIALADAADQDVGDIIMLADFTSENASLRTLLASMIALAVAVGGALYGFFYFYLGRIENKLKKNHEDLTSEIAERKKAEKN